MTKLLITFGLLIAAFSVGTNASDSVEQPIKVEIVSSNEMKEILRQYPNAVRLERRVLTEQPIQNTKDDADQTTSADVLVQYYLGSRRSGDVLAARNQQNRSWSTPQNVQLTLTYPAVGTNGRILTYVSIVVNQSNYGGQAYVVWGGIGYRYIRIIVEAYNTYIFNHVADFYGI